MKSRLFLALVICLAVSFSASAEKKADDSEAVFTGGSRIVITGTLDQSSPIYNRIYGSGVDLTCNLILSLSGAGTAVYYQTHCVTVTDTSPIEMVVDDVATTIGDTFMSLYCDPFDAADATANLVTADDDGGVGLYSAFTLADGITLMPGSHYWLVLTTFSNGAMGDYTINTSTNVVTCDPVSVDGSTWGTIKALYH